MVKTMDSGTRFKSWFGSNPGSTTVTCVALDMLFKLSVPQLSHLENEDNNAHL